MTRHYLIIKSNDNQICYINYEIMSGITFKPLNSFNIDDGVIVAKMVLYDENLIVSVLKRKIKIKLNQYLNLILSDTDDDSSDPSKIRAALNSLTRFRTLVLNNYRKYLDDKYIEMLLTKIAVIEEELKNKLVYLLYGEDEIEHTKSR